MLHRIKSCYTITAAPTTVVKNFCRSSLMVIRLVSVSLDVQRLIKNISLLKVTKYYVVTNSLSSSNKTKKQKVLMHGKLQKGQTST